jgi:hypothetical protein
MDEFRGRKVVAVNLEIIRNFHPVAFGDIKFLFDTKSIRFPR